MVVRRILSRARRRRRSHDAGPGERHRPGDVRQLVRQKILDVQVADGLSGGDVDGDRVGMREIRTGRRLLLRRVFHFLDREHRRCHRAVIRRPRDRRIDRRVVERIPAQPEEALRDDVLIHAEDRRLILELRPDEGDVGRRLRRREAAERQLDDRQRPIGPREIRRDRLPGQRMRRQRRHARRVVGDDGRGQRRAEIVGRQPTRIDPGAEFDFDVRRVADRIDPDRRLILIRERDVEGERLVDHRAGRPVDDRDRRRVHKSAIFERLDFEEYATARGPTTIQFAMRGAREAKGSEGSHGASYLM